MLDPEDDKTSQMTTYMAIRCSGVWLRLTRPSSVSGIAFLPVVTGFFDTAFLTLVGFAALARSDVAFAAAIERVTRPGLSLRGAMLGSLRLRLR
jgi:hypothetical protein